MHEAAEGQYGLKLQQKCQPNRRASELKDAGFHAQPSYPAW